MRSLAKIFLFIALMSTSLLAQANEGEQAPDFTLTSLENEQFTLTDLEGKVVYIFFFGAECPHCRDNGPITQMEIYEPFMDDEKFVALGIDTWNESAASVNNFKNITGITYPLLLNGRSSLIDYYGNSSSYDRSVVISKSGSIAYKGTGFVNSDVDDVQKAIQTELAIATSNEEGNTEMPTSIRLEQNYPNPFNPSTTISFSLDESAEVSVKVYNMLGVEVVTLENDLKSSGSHTLTFDATNLSSGIYIYRLTAGSTSLTKRMTLLK